MNSAALANQWERFVLAAGDWGSRLLAAAIVAVVAYVVARIARWAVAAAVDRAPFAKSLSTSPADDAGPGVGAKLGDAAFWLVLLFALPQALHALRLDVIVAPLDAMIGGLFAFLPSLFGAALIFAIGLFAANIARRATVATLSATNADGWAAKVGFKSGVTNVAGHLVHALVVIPVAIAALEALRVDSIAAPAVGVLRSTLDAIPRLFGAAIILAIVTAVARFVAGLLQETLPPLGFDDTLRSLGVGDGPGGLSPSALAAKGAMVAIVLFGAVEAARILDFQAASAILSAVLELAGRVAFGAAIIFAGVLIARALGDAVARTAGENAGFVAMLTRAAVVALSVAMGLRFMGLAPEIVTLAFGLILGAIAVAAALAFGLGGRSGAGRLVDEWVDRKALPAPSAGDKPAIDP
jgi:hypothetical protein